MKSYFTFGQAHRHEIDGIVFDKDCIAEVEDDNPREVAFSLFGTKWCWQYTAEEIANKLHFYPRGIIKAWYCE